MEQRRRAERRGTGTDDRGHGPERRVAERRRVPDRRMTDRRVSDRRRTPQRVLGRPVLRALPGGGGLENVMVHRVGRDFVCELDLMTPTERRALWDQSLREVLGFFPLPQRPRPERRPLAPEPPTRID
jgi:hypothetical protein